MAHAAAPEGGGVMAKQDNAAFAKAMKMCLTMCAEQASDWAARAPAADLRDGKHKYFSADFQPGDGSRLDVYCSVSFRPAEPKPEPQRNPKPLMIEGPKR